MVRRVTAPQLTDAPSRLRLAETQPWPRGAVAGLATVLAGALAHQLMFSTLAEDAYISLRYSAQLLAGNGLVFNPGEQVEGYSNFLWVLLVAAGGLVHDNLVDVARALGVLSTLVAVGLSAVVVRRVSGSAWPGVAAAALVASSGTVAAYGPSGLESPLFVVLILAAVLAVIGDRPVLGGVLLAAATMTRPDGAVIALAILGWLAARGRSRQALLLFAAAAAPGAVWTAWRLDYYGHLLPNPIAAKSGMDLVWQVNSGWTYLAEFTGATWPLIALAVAGAALALARPARPEFRPLVLLLISSIVVYSGFFVYAGGDWMPAFRFFVPVIPLLAVLAGFGLASVQGAASRAGAAVAVAAVCVSLVAAAVLHPSMLDRIRLWEQQVNELAHIGAWLDRSLPAGTTIGAFANGALSYHAERLVVVDLLGLTDEHIAREGQRDPFGFVGHAASDWRYIVEDRRPAVIHDHGSGWLTGPSCGVRAELDGAYVPLLFQPAPNKWAGVLVRADLVGEVGPLLSADGEYRPAACP